MDNTSWPTPAEASSGTPPATSVHPISSVPEPVIPNPATAMDSPNNNARPSKKRDPPYCNATQILPQWDRLRPGEPASFDAEFQNYEYEEVDEVLGITRLIRRVRLGRACVVNTKGEVVLDTYVSYRDVPGVTKRLPPQYLGFGVSWEDLKPRNGAQHAEKVERWLERIFQNRPVILHGGKHDKDAFHIRPDALHSQQANIVDTQELYSYEVYGRHHPGLAATAEVILGKAIQQDGHSPVEDAQTTMELYLHKRPYTPPAAPPAARGGRGGRRGRGGWGGRGGNN